MERGKDSPSIMGEFRKKLDTLLSAHERNSKESQLPQSEEVYTYIDMYICTRA
jgi:hypothetical protein